MSQVDSGLLALGKLKFWFAIQERQPILLSHVSDLIPLRWTYFRDNWNFVKQNLINNVDTYSDPDLLHKQIEAMDYLITIEQGNDSSKINPFLNSDTYTSFFAIWDSTPISSIPLTREEEEIVLSKSRDVARYTKTNFVDIRHAFTDARDEIADITGTSDTTYNEVFYRSSIQQLRSAKIVDVEAMANFQSSIAIIDYILANAGFLPTAYIDPFALARQNAQNPDLQIPSYQSGTLVKMNYGESLESLAKRFLGSPDKWLDIAVANGLRPPYIDEVGQALPLTSNGSGSQINLAKLDTFGKPNKDKFYIGQPVFLQSNAEVFVNQRHIISIREVPVSGELILELNGDPTLGIYKTIDNANVRVYQANTINSNFMVMIPNLSAPSSLPSNQVPFFLLSSAEDEKRAGVDFLLNDSTLDLILTPTGDMALSYGLQNAIQNMTLKLSIEQGELFRHPEYGLTNVIGSKITNIDQQKQVLVTSITDMVNSDARYSSLETLNVQADNNAIKISIVVRLAGSGTLLPLNFSVNVG
jgi:hypothetical protein